MHPRDAARLIEIAVRGRAGTWADLGAGEGAFTRALVGQLGPGSRVYAIDRDGGALKSIERWAGASRADVIPIVADFTRVFEIPGLAAGTLDGLLFANSLHYVRDPGATLVRLVPWLRAGGRAVIVEYDRRGPNPWVPHPIPSAAWPALAEEAGLSAPAVTARRPSAFGGDLYVGVADRPGD